jgi:glycyl-tRNA synthetase beta chain
MPALLLEILSEEIPARMQGQAARDLERMAREKLAAAGFLPAGLITYAGPRRLTLAADGLPPRQADRTEELKGPKTTAPQQALDGFLRKTGLTREQLTERDGVWFAVSHRPGRATAEIVAEMVPEIGRAFPWPKSMRWGTGTLRWVRPIRRILCTFDGQVVPFEIDGIASGDLTEGHRFVGSGQPVRARTFDDYAEALRREFVVLDPEERKARILEGARTLTFARGLELIEDAGLLEEVAGLAEWPVPILGDMDPAFLDLPPEVIRTSMRTHQKYFAVRRSAAWSADLQVRTSNPADASLEARAPLSANWTADLQVRNNANLEARAPLAPHFLAVANIEASDGGAAIAQGNARVLSARLNDARFFWDEDRKAGFERWLEKLNGVTFHARLGTMAERVERITALAREIAPLVGADPELAATAARLAKADLASGMVGEFPELQGIMGGYYARMAPYAEARRVFADIPADGKVRPDGSEDPLVEIDQMVDLARTDPEGAWYAGLSRAQVDEVADAVRDHYKPQGPNDAVPVAPVTVAVALADKLDTLVGFFAIDEKPTGSKDPYALRRAALGVIRTLLTNKVRIPLAPEFYDKTLKLLKRQELERRFHERVEPLGGLEGVLPDDEVERLFNEWMPEVSGDDPDLDRPRLEIFSVSWALRDFFADRLKVLLRDHGKRHDLVDAVFALGDDDLVRITARVEALDGFLTTEDGANLLTGYRRAVNILRAEAKKSELPEGAPDPARLAEPEEQGLHAALERVRPAVATHLQAEHFSAAMAELAALRAPVDAFFDRVLVNAPEPDLRANRLRLLGGVRDVMGQVADFGLVAG